MTIKANLSLIKTSSAQFRKVKLCVIQVQFRASVTIKWCW